MWLQPREEFLLPGAAVELKFYVPSSEKAGMWNSFYLLKKKRSSYLHVALISVATIGIMEILSKKEVLALW